MARRTSAFWLWPAAALAAAALGYWRGRRGPGVGRSAGPGDPLLGEEALPEITAPKTEAMLEALVTILAKYLEADLIAFMLLDEAGAELVAQPGVYGIEESEGMLYRISLADEQSSSVRVFKSKKPFFTGDAQHDPRVIASYAKLWKIHSLMVLPLVVDERAIGVMRVGSFRRHHFTARHLELSSLIAQEAAVLVEAAVLSRKLAETAEQLKRVNRIKDDFISTVSHEFKTPLTTIQGFLMLMIDGEAGAVSEQQMRFLKMSVNAAKRLEMLVADILDLSRLAAGAKMEPGPVDLEKLLRQSVERQISAAKIRDLTLSASIEPGLPPALGDAKWVVLAVDNLISNALKFTPAGGKITVGASREGETAKICVADTGVGIDAEDGERVFEKFYRARANAELGISGTGLGLAIVKGIVDRHGGRVWFESKPGEGSRFYFTLPLFSPGAAAAAGGRPLGFGLGED